MNLVDSSGWIEFFLDGENASYFASPIETTKQLLVPTICLYEVFKKVLHECGESEALQVVAHMRRGTVISLDDTLALIAAKFSHQFKIPMADSIILASSKTFRAKLWTQDEHFKDLEEVCYKPKPKY